MRIVVIVKCMLIKLWFVLRWIVKLWWEIFINCVEKWELLWLWMEKDDSWGKGYVCDRESWAGRIATRKYEMTRLSRMDSLVGGHLYWEMWNDMRKEMKCEEMWGWVIRYWYEIIIVIEIDCWLVSMIELWITLIEKYYDWIWTMIGPGGILILCKCEVVCVWSSSDLIYS